MKKDLLFFLIFPFFLQTFGQTNCSDANSDVIYAYSDIKSAYDSNNLDHLRYWSNRSLDAFKRARVKLETCGCKKSYDLAYDAVELLAHVENSETYEDGRFYVKRGKEIAKDVINELELCTEETNLDRSPPINDVQSISELNEEKLKLEKQQLALKQKEKEIKQKLAEQKSRELHLKKEQLIKNNRIVITSNIKSFNQLLTLLDCHAETIKNYDEHANIESKDIDEIRSHYLNVAKQITSSYLKQLDKCSSR